MRQHQNSRRQLLCLPSVGVQKTARKRAGSVGVILGSGADYDRAHYLTAAPRHATFLINSGGVFFLARSARARPSPPLGMAGSFSGGVGS